MSTKTPILIHSWHTPESSGGFNWYPKTPGDGNARLQYDHDVESGDFEHVILMEISVPAHLALHADPDVRDNTVTRYIDTHLLDLIETAQTRHTNAPHDKNTIEMENAA